VKECLKLRRRFWNRFEMVKDGF